MSRSPMWSLVALGGLVSALSGAGVVAVFSDSALTGTNDVTTGEQPHLALQIAGAHVAQGRDFVCSGFTDDISTGLYVATNLQPGDFLASDMCLQNTFSGPLSVTVRSFDLADHDPQCTNDESVYDRTCPAQDGGDATGELSALLSVTFSRWMHCEDFSGGKTETVAWLPDLDATPATLGSLGAGEVACVQTFATYATGATYDQRQAAQTDQATWRFAFDGTE